MSNIPEFHFDFGAVEGQPFEEAAEALFRQMEEHYNAHIKPAPILFGGKNFAAPRSGTIVRESTPAGPNPFPALAPKRPTISGDLMRVKDDYVVKSGKDLGLKDGFVLTGVTDQDVEIFDFLKNYQPGDTVVEGDSGKYDLGKAK